MTNETILRKLERHRAFWTGEAVDVPLVGILQQGWMPLKDHCTVDAIWDEDVMTPGTLRPETFVDDYRRIIGEAELWHDDLILPVQPFPSVPWMEAAMGCPVRCARPNIWAAPIAESGVDLPQLVFDPADPWVRTYTEFLDILGRDANGSRPVAASILRGPADLLAAAIGDGQAALAYVDDPERTRVFLEQATDFSMAFVKHQWDHMGAFHDGSILPQYNIWAPGRTVRLQEDASALLSPDLYEAFLAENDRRLASMAEFSVFHLHTTSRFLLPFLLAMDEINAVQLSKDDGSGHVAELLTDLQAVQRAGKQLILRGRFERDELQALRRGLSPAGLCVQCIVEDVEEGKEQMDALRGEYCPVAEERV